MGQQQNTQHLSSLGATAAVSTSHPSATHRVDVSTGPRPGLFEAVTTAGLEHAGRAAIAAWNQLDGGRTDPDSVLADPPARWRGSGPVVLVVSHRV